MNKPVPENIQDVDSFFDNIPNCEDYFTFLQDKNSFKTAHLLLQESTDSSNSEIVKSGKMIQLLSLLQQKVQSQKTICLYHK